MTETPEQLPLPMEVPGLALEETTMSDFKLDRKIAEFLGVQPVFREWAAFKPDNDGGSYCMSAHTKDEVQKWIDSMPEESWAKAYTPTPMYDYPRYTSSLDVFAAAVYRLTPEQKRSYRDHLKYEQIDDDFIDADIIDRVAAFCLMSGLTPDDPDSIFLSRIRSNETYDWPAHGFTPS